MSNNIKRLIEQAIQSQLPGAVVRKIHPLNEGKKPKPDYIDIDKDGNKKEPMKKAIKDKDHCDSAVDESKKKPSSGLSKKEKSSVVKKAKAGKDIGKKGKGFDALAKKAGGGEKGKKIAAAAMWKNVAREDVNEAEVTPKYTGRETKDGVWHVFRSGKASSEAGPFKSAAECRKWIKQHEDKKLDEAEDGNKTEPMKRAAKEKKVTEASKPDYLDLDKDGNKTEPMKRAAKEKKVTEEPELPQLGDERGDKQQVGKGVYESKEVNRLKFLVEYKK